MDLNLLKKPVICHILMNTEVGGVVSVLEEIMKPDTTTFHYIISLSPSRENYSHKGKPYFFELNYTYDTSYTGWSYLKMALFKPLTRKKCHDLMPIIKTINPDIVHFHTNLKELMIGPVITEQLPNVKLIVTEHVARLDSFTNINPVSKQMLILAFRKFFKPFTVIAVSPSVKNYLMRYRLIRSSEQLVVMENTIDVGLYTPIHFPDKKIISIIYLARINQAKNHAELLHSIKHLSHKNIKLVIAGADEMNGAIQQMAKELGIERLVEFKGSVSHISQLLSNMDIAVFPSTKEGLPIALLEKMASGLPVVVSDIPELTTMVTHQKNGLVYKLGSSKELADRLSDLIENKDLRARLGDEARKYVEKNHSMPLSKKYNAFYHQVLNR